MPREVVSAANVHVSNAKRGGTRTITWATADYLDHPPLQTHFPSKYALLNQARLDRRDPRLSLTQRLGAGMHGVGAQDKVVIMRHSRAKDELCIGSGLEFDLVARRLEGHQFTLPQLVRDQNGTHPHGGPE